MDQPGSTPDFGQPADADEPAETEPPAQTDEPTGTEQPTETDEPTGTEQATETDEPTGTEQLGDSERPPGRGRPAGDDGPQAFTATAKLGAGIAVVGIVGTGMLDFVLSQYGSPAAGRAVWAVGFSLTVLVLWYVVLRPMDITGP